MWETIKTAAAGALSWLGRKAIGASHAMTEATGIVWPPEEHQPRLRRYARNYLLYTGQHESVFVGGYKAEGEAFRYAYDETVEYLAVNFLGRLSKLLSSRLFGEGVQITGPEEDERTQAFIDDLYREEQLQHKFILASRGASYRGDALLKVWYSAEQRRIRISTVLPSIWFPETSGVDRDEIIAHTIGQLLDDPAGDEEIKYLWLERHEKRDATVWITNRVFRAEKDGDEYRYQPADELRPAAWSKWPMFAGVQPEVNTQLGDFLLIHIPNVQTEERGIWGASDYEELLTLQGELNNRMTQREDVLDKHVDPIMVLPAGALSIDPNRPNDPPSVNMDDIRAVELSADGKVPVGRVTWDAHLGPSETELRDLVENIAAVAGIDVQALRPSEGMAPASGRAIKLGQMNTQTTVAEKRLTFGPRVAQVFSVATKLANVPGVALDGEKPAPLDASQIEMRFSDGLPQDEQEDAQYQADRLASGTQHPVDAIMALDGLTREQAEEKYERIQGMQATAIGAPTGLAALGLTFGQAGEAAE